MYLNAHLNDGICEAHRITMGTVGGGTYWVQWGVEGLKKNKDLG